MTDTRRTRGSRGGKGRAGAELAELRVNMRRAALIGLSVFVVFVLFDLYLRAVLFGSARIGRMLLYRVVGIGFWAGLYLWVRRGERSARAYVAGYAIAQNEVFVRDCILRI